MAEPKLITYNGKQYNFDDLEQTVLNNYNDYARRFGYNNNKFQKDYIGLTQILRELRNGNGGIETGRLVFNDTFATDKGDFGKARNKSKHYTNPTWMILDTIQRMDAYDPNAEKKKLSKDTLNNELIAEIGSIENLTPEYRLRAQREAVNKLLNKYSNIGDTYIIDTDFNINDYLNRLRELQSALDSETIDDDNYIFSRLGITNTNKPEEKKKEELKGREKFIASALETGLFDEDTAAKVWEKELPNLRKKWLESQGMQTINQPANNNNSNNNNSGNNSGNNSNKPDSNNNNDKPKNQPELPSSNLSFDNFNKWKDAYNQASKNQKTELELYLLNNADKMSGIPVSRSSGGNNHGIYKNNKGQLYVPENWGQRYKQNSDGIYVKFTRRRNGGYLKLLKNYK